MKKSILIEVHQPVIGGPVKIAVTPGGDMTTMEGIALCHAGMAHFLQVQRAMEMQAAAEAHAAANGLLGPNGLPITQ